MILNPQEILKKVKDIKKEYDELCINVPEDQARGQLLNSHETFAQHYPAMFNLIFKPLDNWEQDIAKLTHLVGLAVKVKKDEITQHNASVQVGEELVNQYVKPKLDKS